MTVNGFLKLIISLVLMIKFSRRPTLKRTVILISTQISPTQHAMILVNIVIAAINVMALASRFSSLTLDLIQVEVTRL